MQNNSSSIVIILSLKIDVTYSDKIFTVLPYNPTQHAQPLVMASAALSVNTKNTGSYCLNAPHILLRHTGLIFINLTVNMSQLTISYNV